MKSHLDNHEDLRPSEVHNIYIIYGEDFLSLHKIKNNHIDSTMFDYSPMSLCSKAIYYPGRLPLKR